MEPTSVKYRPDIDGLRALAVLPVIWFHSDLPGLPGGFTGVDTFFVISGYLITLIIHRELADGSFSFARFYERRVRRIAPALLLTIAASTAAAFVLLLPHELEAFARSAAAALGMVSNVYFWRASDYFALAGRITPLLHTWSLGVEEQFYLLFPAVLFVAERFGKARLAIAVAGILSLVLCIVATLRFPTAAFYLLPTRGWQLMAGAALAVGLLSIPPRAAAAASVAGLALIVAAATLITAIDPYPGWRALVPTIGAALVIGAGPRTPGGRLLSTRPLVGIGKISYSLYLWHWPVFAFLRHWRADLELSAAAAVSGMGLTFLLAILSYRWIERPARRRDVPYRKVVAWSVLGALAILIATGIATYARGLPQRFSPEVTAIAAQREARAPRFLACTDVGFDAAIANCRLGPSGPPAYVLWGDSHASAVSEAVETALRQPGLVLSSGLCVPTAGWVIPSMTGRHARVCAHFNERVLAYIEQQPSVSLVVLSAYWNAYDRAAGAAYWQAQQQLIDRLVIRGKRVIVLAGIPEPGADAPWAAAIRTRFGRPPLQIDCPPASVPLKRATIVDVSAGFCGKKPEDMFIDDSHVSRAAALAIIAPRVALAHVAPAVERQADVAER